MEPIDVLVGLYGTDDSMDRQVVKFIMSLWEKCNLDKVKVFCVERECSPISVFLRDLIHRVGFHLHSCPLPLADSCLEDTGQFCDWMVNNIGESCWVSIMHYDVVFVGDYISFIRTISPLVDAVGTHHDGVVSIRRDTYRRCGVEFRDTDVKLGCTDVGDLLMLRMREMGARHLPLSNRNGTGKSDLFVHFRRGSGHGGKGPDGDSQPHIY